MKSTGKDGEEGWVTMKGNQGTVYVEESDKYYICKKELPLSAAFASASKVLRNVEIGELLEKVEGPKVEQGPVLQRARARLDGGSGAEGWFSILPGKVSPWSPTLKCKQVTALQEGPDLKEAKTVRKLDP